MNAPAYQLVEASTRQHFTDAGTLFQEYAAQLNIDLCFQNFDAELTGLPLMYGAPLGCLVLAMRGEYAMGCGAVRLLGGKECEMKRLYLRPDARGARLGRCIAEHLIRAARRLGYSTMKLDTLADMLAARKLYESLGFRKIPAYYANPIPDAIYMELALTAAE